MIVETSESNWKAIRFIYNDVHIKRDLNQFKYSLINYSSHAHFMPYLNTLKYNWFFYFFLNEKGSCVI